jgi:hypothetical protein
MARINIEQCWWTDPRREKLGGLLGSILMADAVVIRAWKLAQEFWGNDRGLVPIHVFESLEANAKLIEANLAEVRGECVYVRGSSQYLDWVNERRRAARAGGKKSAESRSKSKQKGQANAKQSSTKSKQTQASGSISSSSSDSISRSGSGDISAGVDERPPTAVVTTLVTAPDSGANKRVWEAYRAAYLTRYQVEPARNAKLNANIAQFTARVGADDAPAIAAFFVCHNDSFYVKSMHTFSLCLRDAEALRTQWLKGRAITQIDVRRFEKNQEQVTLLEAIERGEV